MTSSIRTIRRTAVAAMLGMAVSALPAVAEEPPAVPPAVTGLGVLDADAVASVTAALDVPAEHVTLSVEPAVIEAERGRVDALRPTVDTVVTQVLTGRLDASLPGVDADVAVLADALLDYHEDFSEDGALVDLDDVRPLVFDDVRAVESTAKPMAWLRVADDGTGEEVSMLHYGTEDLADPDIALSAAAGFAVERISSGDGNWVSTDNGKIYASWEKYRDFGERDGSARYFAYRRKGNSEPATSYVNRFTKTADLQSGITDASAWKVKGMFDVQPDTDQDYGADRCESVNLGIQVSGASGGGSLGLSRTLCDRLKARSIGADDGHWSRFEAKMKASEAAAGDWYLHDGERRATGFQFSHKIANNQTPYYWDYTDAYFCYRQGSPCYERTH